MLASISYLALLAIWFWASYLAAKYFSEKNFRLKWFWGMVTISIIWGAIQINLAKEGYILILGSPNYIFQENEIVRFAALASALMQTACIPSKEPFRAWF